MKVRRAMRFPGRPRCTATAVLFAVCAAVVTNAAAADDPGVRIEQTPSGIRYGSWGASAGRPAPLVIVLAKTIEGTLGDPVYRQAGSLLAGPTADGERAVCVSIDLPCHGAEWRQGEPKELAGWRHRLERGEDPIAANNRRLSHLVDHLVGSGRVDPRRIAVIGTSRGGFLALHFLAHDPRVACAAAYAPVTDLAALSEFHGAESLPVVRSAALHGRADALAGRPAWITIGGNDERVGTGLAISLAGDVVSAAAACRRPNRLDLRVVADSPGHTTPAGAAAASAAWIRDRFAEALAAGEPGQR